MLIKKSIFLFFFVNNLGYYLFSKTKRKLMNNILKILIIFLK